MKIIIHFTDEQKLRARVPFHVAEWRSGKNLPKNQGLVLGCVGKKNAVTALVDVDDIHCPMIGALFYDAAEGLLTAFVLLLAEYLPPTEDVPPKRRHIVNVFKLVQDLLAPSKATKGKNGFQVLMNTLPDTHKARWFAGAALNSAEQAMASVMSTVLSKALGSRTVMSGSVSKGGGKDSASRSLQMMERSLMTPDELKSIPKGQFVVMKTGTHPIQTRLRLFLEWGISFGDPYLLPERAARTVAYVCKQELEQAIV